MDLFFDLSRQDEKTQHFNLLLLQVLPAPTHSIHVWYIYLHEWLILMVNVGKYTIHGSHGLWMHFNNECFHPFDANGASKLPGHSCRKFFAWLPGIAWLENDGKHELRCITLRILTPTTTFCPSSCKGGISRAVLGGLTGT